MDKTRSEETARRNDIARQLSLGVTVTNRAAKLPDLEGLLRSVRTYNDFTEKNDPYQAHDMGFFEWRGERVVWKIDYYNRELSCYEDPTLPTCQRVLSVMCAYEY